MKAEKLWGVNRGAHHEILITRIDDTGKSNDRLRWLSDVELGAAGRTNQQQPAGTRAGAARDNADQEFGPSFPARGKWLLHGPWGY